MLHRIVISQPITLKKLVFVLLLAAFNNAFGQRSLSSDLSALFGNLSMDKPVKEIIAQAEKNKNFKGASHYNLDLSYSGEVKATRFFSLKPEVCFVEIVSDSRELFPDSALTGVAFFSFDAGYSNSDTLSLRKEFDRISGLFSAHFFEETITRNQGSVYCYASKADKRPVLNIYMTQESECYNNKRCIKLVYFKQ